MKTSASMLPHELAEVRRKRVQKLAMKMAMSSNPLHALNARYRLLKILELRNWGLLPEQVLKKKWLQSTRNQVPDTEEI